MLLAATLHNVDFVPTDGTNAELCQQKVAYVVLREQKLAAYRQTHTNSHVSSAVPFHSRNTTSKGSKHGLIQSERQYVK